MQFSLEKGLEKGKWIHPTHYTQLMNFVIKIVILIHQFYNKFFHLSQNVYHGMEKKHVKTKERV